MFNFLESEYSSWHQTNSVEALKVTLYQYIFKNYGNQLIQQQQVTATVWQTITARPANLMYVNN